MRTKVRFFYFLLLIFFLQAVLVSIAAAATRIMPLGDSITYGSFSGAVPDLPAYYVSYRKALWDKLVDAGYDVDFVGSLTNGSSVPDFDNDHEGHPGATDDGIASSVYGYLLSNRADIILLHIGTNELDPSPNDVENILNEIDRYESDSGTEIWVILALIVNRACCNEAPLCTTQCLETTEFNDNVYYMAQDRIDNPANPAYPDKIRIVDMETDADIVYYYAPTGDMFDEGLGLGGIHPYETGYAKMADLWFSALEQILPDPDPDPPNNSSSSDSGCFISTAVYGSHMEPQINTQGEFRRSFKFTDSLVQNLLGFSHTVLRYFSTSHPFSLSLPTRPWCSNQKGLGKEEDLNP